MRGKKAAPDSYTQTTSLESLQSLDIQQQNSFTQPNNEIMNELAQPMEPNPNNNISAINTISRSSGMGENEI